MKDALVLFRPHDASNTDQAALNALLIERLLVGEIVLASWDRQVLDYAHEIRLRSVPWGCWYQVGYLSFFAGPHYVVRVPGIGTSGLLDDPVGSGETKVVGLSCPLVAI